MSVANAKHTVLNPVSGLLLSSSPSALWWLHALLSARMQFLALSAHLPTHLSTSVCLTTLEWRHEALWGFHVRSAGDPIHWTHTWWPAPRGDHHRPGHRPPRCWQVRFKSNSSSLFCSCRKTNKEKISPCKHFQLKENESWPMTLFSGVCDIYRITELFHTCFAWFKVHNNPSVYYSGTKCSISVHPAWNKPPLFWLAAPHLSSLVYGFCCKFKNFILCWFVKLFILNSFTSCISKGYLKCLL